MVERLPLSIGMKSGDSEETDPKVDWSVHLKWLAGIVAFLATCFTAWTWIEGRIERQVEARLTTASTLAGLVAGDKALDAKIDREKGWLLGKVEVLESRCSALERELTVLRQPKPGN